MTDASNDGAPLLVGAFARLRNVWSSDAEWIERSLGHPATAISWRRANVLNPSGGFFGSVIDSSDVLLVVERRSDATPIGLVQAYALDPIDQHASIAIAVDPRVQGGGWPMEAVGLFADYLFSTLALHKLYFAMLETSPAHSARMSTWLEFEGCLRKREYRDGQLRDLYVYAMYRTFWTETMRPAFVELARARSARKLRRNKDG